MIYPAVKPMYWECCHMWRLPLNIQQIDSSVFIRVSRWQKVDFVYDEDSWVFETFGRLKALGRMEEGPQEKMNHALEIADATWFCRGFKPLFSWLSTRCRAKTISAPFSSRHYLGYFLHLWYNSDTIAKFGDACCASWWSHFWQGSFCFDFNCESSWQRAKAL